MKKLIFIDDNFEILNAQITKMKELLKDDGNRDVELSSLQCDLSSAPDCLDNQGEIAHPGDPSYQQANQTLENIVETIHDIINEGTVEKVELVIDLLLDDKDETLGFKLVKYILSHIDKTWFDQCRLVITITSSYRSADFSNLKSQFLSPEEQDKIIECYRPIVINENGQVEFNTALTAFPRFYAQFHIDETSSFRSVNKLLLDKDSVPGNTGTHYGNYFGLIYARLYKDERAM